MGGLSRRAHIINKIKGELTKPVLVLDAGAMLFPNPSLAQSLYPAKTAQAEGLIEAMAQMGYDAFGLAPYDLSAGTAFLINQPAGRKLPWLSMNLTRAEGQPLLFEPYTIKQVGDMSAAILGLTGALHGETPQQPADYQLLGWEERLPSVLEQVKNQTDMVILLSSLTERENRQIAEKYPDIHLIIESGQSTSNKSPYLVNNTLITQIGSRGKYAGRLDIDWQDSRRWEQSVTDKIKPLRDRLDRTNWHIGRLVQRRGTDGVQEDQQYKQLRKEANELTAELAKYEAINRENQGNLSTFEGSFIPLSVSLPEDKDIKEIVRKTQNAVNESGKSILAQTAASPAAQQPFANMAGWQACRACHPQQTEFWHQTGHTRAWQTLENANRQFNPECIICHVTLPTYDEKTVAGQNLLAGLMEEFKTIGCETCHGPAKDHSTRPEGNSLLRPTEQTCLTCHTPEHDDNFVFEEKLEKIRCPTDGNNG